MMGTQATLQILVMMGLIKKAQKVMVDIIRNRKKKRKLAITKKVVEVVALIIKLKIKIKRRLEML